MHNCTRSGFAIRLCDQGSVRRGRVVPPGRPTTGVVSPQRLNHASYRRTLHICGCSILNSPRITPQVRVPLRKIWCTVACNWSGVMTPEIGSSSETSAARHAWADLSARWQRTLRSGHGVQPLCQRLGVTRSDIGNDEELIRAGWFVVDRFQDKQSD